MKTWQRIAVVCAAIGLLGGVFSYGAAGDLQPRSPGSRNNTSSMTVGFSTLPPIIADRNDSHFTRAAELFNLGQVYFQGGDGLRDDGEAAYYYNKSAELGDARAQIRLGMMYANGRGVQKDFDEAIYWIRQAFELAQLSRNDVVVEEAVAWLQKASGYGYASAQRTLELIEKRVALRNANTNKSPLRFWQASSHADIAGHNPVQYLESTNVLVGQGWFAMKLSVDA